MDHSIGSRRCMGWGTGGKNEGRRQRAEGSRQKEPVLTSAFCLLPSAFIDSMKRLLRPFSRLTFRLLAFNLILVFFPIGGVLFLGQYEQRLESAEIRDLTDRSRLIAASLAREGTLDPDAFEDVIRRAKIDDMRVRLIDSAGHVVADSQEIVTPEVQ